MKNHISTNFDDIQSGVKGAVQKKLTFFADMSAKGGGGHKGVRALADMSDENASDFLDGSPP